MRSQWSETGDQQVAYCVSLSLCACVCASLWHQITGDHAGALQTVLCVQHALTPTSQGPQGHRICVCVCRSYLPVGVAKGLSPHLVTHYLVALVTHNLRRY